jgi:hypothetical protein
MAVDDGAMRILRPLAVLAVLVVALTSAACSTSTPAAAPAQTTHPSSNIGQDPVPNQLWGTWEPTVAVIGPGSHLVFSEHSYSTYADDIDTGVIARAWASGSDQINLGARGSCETYGTYTWKIDAGVLTLSGGSNDMCPRRQGLISHAFKKTSDSTKPADTDLTR